MTTRRDRKTRLTVTIEPSLVRAGQDAVRAGLADSLSAWVGRALEERAAKERRLQAMRDAIGAYEAEFGAITPSELAAQERADRQTARVVRGTPPNRRPVRRPRRSPA